MSHKKQPCHLSRHILAWGSLSAVSEPLTNIDFYPGARHASHPQLATDSSPWLSVSQHAHLTEADGLSIGRIEKCGKPSSKLVNHPANNLLFAVLCQRNCGLCKCFLLRKKVLDNVPSNPFPLLLNPPQILKTRVHLQFWKICDWPIWLFIDPL